MAISLQKGQKISLSKEGGAGLSRVVIGLGWDAVTPEKKGLLGGLFAPKTPDVDCDASVIMLREGKLTYKEDLIYFGNLQHPTGSVRHTGDNLTGDGDGDDEQVIIELGQVPAEYDKLVFVVNIYGCQQRNQHFGMIQNAFIRVVNAANNQEICRYSLSNDYAGKTALVFAEVYRHGGEWKFNAIGEGTNETDLGQMANRYSKG